MRFRQLPLHLQTLIAIQAIAAAVLAYQFWSPPPSAEGRIIAALLLGGAIGGACNIDVNVRLGRMVLTLGFMVAYFSLVFQGLSMAVVTGLVGTLSGLIFNLQEEKRRFQPHKALTYRAVFNCSNCVLATLAMGQVYLALGGQVGRVDPASLLLAVPLSALTYYGVNIGGVSVAIGWSQRIRPADVFRTHFAWTWIGFLASAYLSAGLLWLVLKFGFADAPAVVLLLLPGYLIWYLQKLRNEKDRADLAHAQEMNRLNDAIISSLAMAVDAKDRHTGQHVDRVREYAVTLARKLGVPESEIQAVRIASLLHDIGKIGVPEQILCKPGKLSPEEFEIMKTHVEIGAAILEQVRFPWPVVPIVMTHHERWDGLGYPRALSGEDIPIGGRIVSMVDVFDALTSDRPYRRAIPREQAIEILKAARGTQFDPRVVDTFIESLPEMDAAIRAIPPRTSSELWPLAAELPAAPAPVVGLSEDDEEEALRKLEAMVRPGVRFASLGSELPELLARLVPFSTFALFLHDHDRQCLVPVFTGGLWTRLFEGMEIRPGEGCTGHVVRLGEPVVNASATLDLARAIRPGENLELNSTLAVPLVQQGVVQGALTVYHSNYNFYQPAHVRRLTRVARCLVETLQWGRSQDAESRLARHDPATQLPNRYSLLQFLHGQLLSAQAREEEFAVVLLGIEGLSALEEAGDREGVERILRSSGKCARDTIREEDYVARFSWSTFAVALPGCAERQAHQVMQRLQERIETAVGADAPIAMRVGVSVYPVDGASGETLLQAAERRMAVRSTPASRASGTWETLPKSL